MSQAWNFLTKVFLGEDLIAVCKEATGIPRRGQTLVNGEGGGARYGYGESSTWIYIKERAGEGEG